MIHSFLLPEKYVNIENEFYKLYFLDIDSSLIKDVLGCEKKSLIYSTNYLGEEFEGVFYPSYFCLELFSLSVSEVIVNTKNAWHFSLGKALAFDSIVMEVPKKMSSNKFPKSGEYFIVKNGYNEILGVVQKKAKSYFNVFDIGHYLRRELT